MDIQRRKREELRVPAPHGRLFLDDTPSLPSPLPPVTTAPRRPLSHRPAFWFGMGFFLVGLGGIFLWLIFAQATLTNALHFENRELSFFESLRVAGKSYFQKTPALVGEDTGRVNILLLGRAGESYPGKNLTDTVMILSLDTNTHRAALLSLPRDLFVPIGTSGTSTKLNALYQYGLNQKQGSLLVRESVSLVTGLPLPYVVIIDFDGFERVIDTLGGIRVEVPRDFYDPRYPGKNYSYETFELKAGWQKLDGATALKYARERHDDPEGDFGRAKRQQQILEAVADRVFSGSTFLNPFALFPFLESLGGSVTTNLTPGEISRLLELAPNFDRRNIDTAVVDAWKPSSLLRVDHLDTPTGRAFLLVPRSGTWDEVHTLARDLFDRERETKRREKISREQSTVRILSGAKNRLAAEAFLSSLKTEFPLARVSLETHPSLDERDENAIIQGEGKPFTLDSLLKRYALERGDVSLPKLTPSKETDDFLILFTRQTFQDVLVSETEIEHYSPYDFQEPLPPQENRGVHR